MNDKVIREIGGYLELYDYRKPHLHSDLFGINSARNALAILLRNRKIKRIWIPELLCESVANTCISEGVEVIFYSVGEDFWPQLKTAGGEWVYIVNYYGQLTNDNLEELKNRYGQIIVDNVQAYYQEPIAKTDTIYSCRKYFGVPDGGFLSTELDINPYPREESYQRMQHILGRYERTANEFYASFQSAEEEFNDMPVKFMSKLTENLLRGIDYAEVKDIRNKNFEYLHSKLRKLNRLNLIIPTGAYMYPLYLNNGRRIRKMLLADKIYIPVLWPNVLRDDRISTTAYNMANDILPLPVDQRYNLDDMQYMIDIIISYSEVD